MVLIQNLARDLVIEGLQAPGTMARVADAIEPGEWNGNVALAAAQLAMVPAKLPSGGRVIEGRRLGLAMLPVAAVAFLLVVYPMTGGAGLMMFAHRLGAMCALSSRLVASFAVVLMMAFRTGQAEAMNVFIMTENDALAWSCRCPGGVDFCLWLRNGGMHSSHDVVFAQHGSWLASAVSSCFWKMADRTAFLVAPLPMTIQALAMIGPLKPGFANVLATWGDLVTGLACRVGGALWRIVVANGAASGHFCHGGVSLMVERDRKVAVLQFVQDHDVWPQPIIEGPLYLFARRAQAGLKAAIFDSWRGALMAPTAVGQTIGLGRCCLGDRASRNPKQSHTDNNLSCVSKPPQSAGS